MMEESDATKIRKARSTVNLLNRSDVLKHADPPDDGKAYTMWECINMLKDDGKLSGTKIGT
jgi:hypothetical protein